VRYPPVEQTAAGERVATTLRLLWSRRGFVVLALMCQMGIVGESVAILWQVIYLNSLGASAAVSGAAFALFNGAMFVGRLVNAPLVARRGARFSLVLSGILLIVTTVLLLISRDVTVAIAAFMLLGIAVAGVVPTVLSVAADLSPGNSGAVAGGMMAAAYAGFIFCPPIIGWVAELFELRLAMLSVGLSGVLLLWLVRQLERASLQEKGGSG
jgi:fucose permease